MFLNKSNALKLIASLLLISSAVLINFFPSSHLSSEHLATPVRAAVKPSMPTGQPDAKHLKLNAIIRQADADLAVVIHQALDSSQLSADEINYEQAEVTSLGLHKSAASFSVTSRYQTVRTFLTSILSNHPNTALDTLQCTRPDIAEPEVECAIRLVAWRAPARSGT
ncbi:hypothetical protein KSF73_16785 [Burkholderiaceae bacterium DAT-1]|nr:hypothetical protein [Burkholderiaceae bacterium DAT-1]